MGILEKVSATYIRIHFTVFNFVVRLSDIIAIPLGLAVALWGIWLLVNREATIDVNGVPTADIAPKIIMIAGGAFFSISGVHILRAKPYWPGKTPMF